MTNDFTSNNLVQLLGVAGKPVFDHEHKGLQFYRFTLSVQRMSGEVDTINALICYSKMPFDIEQLENATVNIVGRLRTYVSRDTADLKRSLCVLVTELVFTDANSTHINRVLFDGYLCRDANLRTTTKGKSVCDLTVLVNRDSTHCERVPVICWGITAQEFADKKKGTHVSVQGRLQSRSREKKVEGEVHTWEVTEVSASLCKVID